MVLVVDTLVVTLVRYLIIDHGVFGSERGVNVEGGLSVGDRIEHCGNLIGHEIEIFYFGMQDTRKRRHKEASCHMIRMSTTCLTNK